jgi:DNA-directed RNA polymerase subunit RPC12/RpoP
VVKMGRCPNCQRSSFFLKKASCLVCGKQGCESCFTFIFRIVDELGSKLQDAYVCSESCFESIATQINNQIKPSEITVDNVIPPFHYFVSRHIFRPENFSKFNPKVQWHLRKKRYMNIWFSKKVPLARDLNGLGKRFDNFIENPHNLLWQKISLHVRLIQAKHFETLREFENAAKVYKSLGMYEEAGKVRAKRDELTVKRTDVSLNLNALLKQVKDGGIVAIYRCPHCGRKLKVGSKTTLKSLRTCEHCGSEIEAVDLADFLKTALS